MHSISKQFYCVVLKNTKAKKENIRKNITTGRWGGPVSVLQAFQWRYVSSQEKHSSLPSLQWAHLYFFWYRFCNPLFPYYNVFFQWRIQCCGKCLILAIAACPVHAGHIIVTTHTGLHNVPWRGCGYDS